MNIFAINNINYAGFFRLNNKSFSPEKHFMLTMSAPLTHDTVSFNGTPKGIADRTQGVSLAVAKQIHKSRIPIQEQIETIIRYIFADKLVTKEAPNNLVERILGRVKTAESIMEKSSGRKLNTKKEILANMTDLNGIKICLTNGDKESVKKVLDIIKQQIENGTIILTEIENKIPKAVAKKKRIEALKYSYASEETMEELCKASEQQKHKVNFIPRDYTESNYSAIHLLVKFPIKDKTTHNFELQTCEIQIMGHDMSIYKQLDDLIYKIINGKNVNKKYEPICKILEPIVMPDELFKKTEQEIMKLSQEDLLKLGCSKNLAQCSKNTLFERIKQRKEFDQYRGKVFMFQREKEPLSIEARGDDMEFFFPLSSKILSRKFDVNYLYKVMKTCDSDVTRTGRVKPTKKSK